MILQTSSRGAIKSERSEEAPAQEMIERDAESEFLGGAYLIIKAR